MDKSISKILIIVLCLTISGCCYFCKPDPEIKIQEVYLPVYACPAPINIERPAILNVKFSNPLDEKSIVGLDEQNYKNQYINNSNLLFYIDQLEKQFKVYKEEQSKIGKPLKEVRPDVTNSKN